jgi:NADPH:quinone reductase-like Zn-dependent oxidoreductase
VAVVKAAVATRYGGPEVVRVVDVDEPEPAAGELLVAVHATTVNRTDCGYRGATPFFIRAFSGLARPRTPVLGTEFAGVVESCGPDVTSFAVGDGVFGYCEGTFGAHAERMTVPASGHVATIPPGISFREIAPATEGWHYAMSCIRKAGIRPGADVLVHGATGAIGSAAVQILTSMDVHVDAVCGAGQVELVAGLGADRVIDRTVEDFTESDRTYDVVFDAVGKSTFGRCRRLLRPGGSYMVTDLGPWAQNPLLQLVTRLGRGRRVMMAFPRDDPQMIHEVRSMIEVGTFRPVIDRGFPLARIADAYRYVETGQKIGNVVIDVRTSDDQPGSP